MKRLVRASKEIYGASIGSMTVEEFMQDIRDTYNNYFPRSTCQVKLVRSLGKNIKVQDFYIFQSAFHVISVHMVLKYHLHMVL